MGKKYGMFEDTLEDLKKLVPLASTVERVRFEGPSRKVAAILTMAGLAGEFIERIERLESHIQVLCNAAIAEGAGPKMRHAVEAALADAK